MTSENIENMITKMEVSPGTLNTESALKLNLFTFYFTEFAISARRR